MNYLKWKDHRQQVRDRRDEVRAQLEMIDLRIQERYPEQREARIPPNYQPRGKGGHLVGKAVSLALFVAVVIVLSGFLLHDLWHQPKEAQVQSPTIVLPCTPSTIEGDYRVSWPTFEADGKIYPAGTKTCLGKNPPKVSRSTSNDVTITSSGSTFSTITGGYEMTQPITVGQGTSASCVSYDTQTGVLPSARACVGVSTK